MVTGSVATVLTQAQLQQMARKKEMPNLLSKRLKDARLRLLERARSTPVA